MRTKTLLLTAALSAAGIATSMAQVYSQNAVGYINLSIPKGFSLIANQLVQPSYTLTALIGTNVPDNTQIYKLLPTGLYSISNFDPFDHVWIDVATSSPSLLTIDLGGGVWINAPSAITVTFVGEVPQGTLTTPTPKGFSIVSSQVPQAGDVTALGLTAGADDTIYKFVNATGLYDIYNYDPFDLVWKKTSNSSNVIPSVGVGESFFLFRAAVTPASWTRTFSVN